MNWTVEQLLGEIAAILVRLENGREDDAREMCNLIVGGTEYHDQAFEEFVEEFEEDYPACDADYTNHVFVEDADAFRQQMLTALHDLEGEAEEKP